MPRLLLCLLLTGLLVIQTLPAAAAPAPTRVTMTARGAFGAYFKFGEWLPIQVTIENPESTLTAEIRVAITNQYGRLNYIRPVELPSGARKRYTIYTLPNSFSRSLEVELIQGRTTLMTDTVRLTVLPNDRYVIGLAASDLTGVPALNPPHLPGRRDRSEMINLSLADIPDRPEGLRLLNALILNNVDTGGLTAAQQTALTGWVAGGGRLILGGGVGARRTLAGLPAELQPVTLIEQREVTALPALEAFVNHPIPVPGPFLLAAAEPDAGTNVLVSQETAGGQAPLIVERALGQGHVDFVALDLSQAPFNAWGGSTPFARQLLAPGSAWSNRLSPDVSPTQMSNSQMIRALSNLPALDLPSIRLLGLLLVSYIILVGPVNYLLLRRLDRLAWAWATIPLLTLVVSALAYTISFGLRGAEVIVNQVGVIESGSDGQVIDSRIYVGVFSPTRRAYDLEIGRQALIRPLGNRYDPWNGATNTGSGVLNISQGDPVRVRGLAVNQWSMQSFVAEGAAIETPALQGRLAAGFDRLQGQLVNRGHYTLDDVIVVFKSQFQKLGSIEPGETVEVRLDFDSNRAAFRGFGSYFLFQDEFNGPTGPSRDVAFKQSVIDGVVFNQPGRQFNQPIFLAWINDSPVPVNIKGREVTNQKSSLLFGPLSLSFDGPQVGIPPGFSRLETMSTSGDAGVCDYGPGWTGIHLIQGSVEARLVLPDAAHHIRPQRLEIYIQNDGDWSRLPAVELYDRTGEEWIPLENARTGLNPINEPQRFYDSDSASVQLRISSANHIQGNGCLFFELAMEGQRS